MRIVSGSTTESVYFVAFSTVDHIARVTGLGTFNVYCSANGTTGTTHAITVSEINSTQMPGVYRALIADSTITTLPSGIDSRELCLHITSSMDPVTRTVELYRRTVTTGATLVVDSSGAGNADVKEIAGAAPSTGTAHFGVNAVTVGSSAQNEIADSVLNRDMSVGIDSGSSAIRTPRQAMRFLRNKWAISGGTLTVYKEDDTNASWTATVTTNATADPITGSDPA